MNKISRREYKSLFEFGKRKYTENYIFFWMPFSRNVLKVGIIKKFGNAVKRNKEKRRVRSFLRSFNPVNNCFLLIIIRRPCDETSLFKRSFLLDFAWSNVA